MFQLLAAAGLIALPLQDTVHVRADNPPVWGEELALVEEVRIGSLMGAEEYTFGHVAGVAVTADGTIWVADSQAEHIRRYDADGGYIDTIGREGAGPGEFRDLSNISRTPEGDVVAWDSRLKRLTFFRPSGAVRSTTSVPTSGVAGAHGYDGLRTDVAGGVLVYTVAQVDGELRGATLRVDREGKVLGVLNHPAAGHVGPTGGNRFYGFGTMSAFAGLTLSALGPDGRFWSGRTDEYALWRPLDDGRVLRIERSWTPLRVERGMHRETEARIEHFSPRTGEDPDQDVPDTKPAFWHLWVDQEGRFWVATHNAASNVGETEAEREAREKYDNPPVVWWEPFICDVISADGEFLGTVAFPNRQTRIHVTRGRWLWVVEEGEYGEHYVVRYRIESR